MNCVPVTVNVNAGPFAAALEGESEEMAGTGLGGALIVKLSELDVPPPGVGVCTATVAAPIELRSEAGTCAVSEVFDT